MKKSLIAFAVLLGLSASSYAVNAPKDSTGAQLPTIDWIGASTCRLTSADTTSGKLCTTGSGQVYGVVVSSCANTNYVVMRDSATANTSSTPIVTNWCFDSGATAAGSIMFKYPVPMQFTNGLSANVNSTLTGVGEIVILYRARSAND
jgi:hypothetical protein